MGGARATTRAPGRLTPAYNSETAVNANPLLARAATVEDGAMGHRALPTPRQLRGSVALQRARCDGGIVSGKKIVLGKYLAGVLEDLSACKAYQKLARGQTPGAGFAFTRRRCGIFAILGAD
jgi:hypothetical protein